MIAYHQRGEGEPLLLLNGMGVSSRGWPEEWLQRLERSFRLILMDNRGTGGSTHTGDPYTIGDLASDAAGVLDRCGFEAAHVLGQSMGGMIAVTFALEHPERTHRLVLVSSTPGGEAAVSPAPEILMGLGALARDQSLARELSRLVAAPGFGERHPEKLAALGASLSGDQVDMVVIGSQMHAMSSFDPSRLGEVRVPTLVLHGEVDPLVPVENGNILTRAIPDARLEVLDGVGHLLTYEATEQCARLVEEFLGVTTDQG